MPLSENLMVAMGKQNFIIGQSLMHQNVNN